MSISENKLILKDVSLGLTNKGVSLCTGLITSVLLARYLGPNLLGQFTFVISFLNFFNPLLDLGISQVIVKELNINKFEENEILSSGFILKLIGSLLSLIIFSIIMYNFNFNEIDNKYFHIMSLLLIIKFFDIFKFYFEGKSKFKYIYISSIFSLIISSIIIFIGVYLKKDLVFFFFAKLFEYFLIAFIYVLIFFKENTFKINIDTKVLKEIISQAYPLILSGVVMILYLRIDQLMIGKYLGAKELGIYSVGVKFSEIWYFFPGLLASNLFPGIVKAYNEKNGNYKIKKQQLYFLEIVFSICYAIIMTLISKTLILNFYGEVYKESYKILNIYVWAGIPYSLLPATSKILLLTGRVKAVFLRSLITAIVNIVLNHVFINKFGLVGAAYSTLVSYMFIVITLFFIPGENEFLSIITAVKSIKKIGKK